MIGYVSKQRVIFNIYQTYQRMLAKKQQSQFKDVAFSSIIINVNPVEEDQEEYIERRQLLSPDLKDLISESTYYQTHHPTRSQFPNNRKCVTRKPSLPVGTSPIRDKRLILKNLNLKSSLAQFQISPQQYQSGRVKQLQKNLISQSHWAFSPRKQSLFRTRMIRPLLPSSLQQKPIITSQSYCAMWTDSSEGLLVCAQNQRRQIASLTKIMTAFTVLGLCQQYSIKVREQWIPIHSRAHYMQGTSANLKSGQQILLIDLLYGLLLPSGNDAGIALAQYFGKFLSFKLTKEKKLNFVQCVDFYDHQYERQSIRLFVFEMNRFALRLGLTNTRFDNPTGLTNADNYSSAKDIALLTAACLKNHLLRLIFRRKVHKCQVKNDKLGYNREVIWHNTNKQLYKVRECLGVKTGITPGAGPCLSAAYRVGHKQLVVVVLNSHDHQTRFEDAQKLYRCCRKQIIN